MKSTTTILTLGALCALSLAAPIDPPQDNTVVPHVKVGESIVTVAPPISKRDRVIPFVEAGSSIIKTQPPSSFLEKKDTIVPVVPVEGDGIVQIDGPYHEGRSLLEKRDTIVPVVPVGGNGIVLVDGPYHE